MVIGQESTESIMTRPNNVTSFQDLDVWKSGRDIRKRLYLIANRLPNLERYNLASQIRRTAVSLTVNIAEGYARFHFKENVQCCRISRGSAYELMDHLITCRDESYLTKDEVESLHEELLIFIRLLNGYIRSIGTTGH